MALQGTSLSTSPSMPIISGDLLARSQNFGNSLETSPSISGAALSVISSSPGMSPPSSPEKTVGAPTRSVQELMGTLKDQQSNILGNITTVCETRLTRKELKQTSNLEAQQRREAFEAQRDAFEAREREVQEQVNQQLEQKKKQEVDGLVRLHNKPKIDQLEKYVGSRLLANQPLLEMLWTSVDTAFTHYADLVKPMEERINRLIMAATSKVSDLPEAITQRASILGRLNYLEQQLTAYRASKTSLIPDETHEAPPYAKPCLTKVYQQIYSQFERIVSDFNLIADQSREGARVDNLIHASKHRIEEDLRKAQITKKQNPNLNGTEEKMIDSIFTFVDISQPLQASLKDFIYQFMKEFDELHAMLEVEATLQLLPKGLIEGQQQKFAKLKEQWPLYASLLSQINDEKIAKQEAQEEIEKSGEEFNDRYQEVEPLINKMQRVNLGIVSSSEASTPLSAVEQQQQPTQRRLFGFLS